MTSVFVHDPSRRHRPESVVPTAFHAGNSGRPMPGSAAEGPLASAQHRGSRPRAPRATCQAHRPHGGSPLSLSRSAMQVTKRRSARTSTWADSARRRRRRPSARSRAPTPSPCTSTVRCWSWATIRTARGGGQSTRSSSAPHSASTPRARRGSRSPRSGDPRGHQRGSRNRSGAGTAPL